MLTPKRQEKSNKVKRTERINNMNPGKAEVKNFKAKESQIQLVTSLPIIAIEGIVRSHGTSPNVPTSKGLVHNNTSVAATISYIKPA